MIMVMIREFYAFLLALFCHFLEHFDLFHDFVIGHNLAAFSKRAD